MISFISQDILAYGIAPMLMYSAFLSLLVLLGSCFVGLTGSRVALCFNRFNGVRKDDNRTATSLAAA